MVKYYDLTGKRYGRWFVSSYSKTVNNRKYWLCRCDCGETRDVSGKSLRNGSSKSCGCSRLLRRSHNFVDISGLKFGRLTVIAYIGRDDRNHATWSAKCECGNSINVTGTHLRSGNTKSCGCNRIEMAIKATKTHGMSNSPTYATWKSIKRRCLNKNTADYKNYGGRGIKVCDRWLNSFKDFLSDMGEKPERLSIERINGNGNYELSNCKWATRTEQNNNTRASVFIEHGGYKKTIAEWGRSTGINASAIGRRLRSGWSINEALETPIGHKRIKP